MTLASLTYLTFDSLAEGVGASQVVPYVERLAQHLDVVVHSFEKDDVEETISRRLEASGVRWISHRFGRGGSVGGALRTLRGARLISSAQLVHARSDLPAASALLARPPHWVWDVRSFWADERIVLGSLKPGSPQDRMLRRIERAAAERSSAIVTLTRAAIDVLVERFGPEIESKAEVVPTCVDLDRFEPAALPDTDVLRLLFSGTLNAFYDVPAMIGLTDCLGRRRRAEFHVLSPGATAWDEQLTAAGVVRAAAAPWEVRPHLVASHAGLSVCRLDAGMSLRARLPTKIGEFLACGRPVVVNEGLGDLDDLLRNHRCGVLVSDTSDDGLDAAASLLENLIEDPHTPSRCRRLAEEHFSVDRGVERLLSLYKRALGNSS